MSRGDVAGEGAEGRPRAWMPATLDVLDGALGELGAPAAGDGALPATLRFVRGCVAGPRPVTDAEWPFLLEDLKLAGLPGRALRAVAAGLRAVDGVADEVTAALVSLVDLPDVDEAVVASAADGPWHEVPRVEGRTTFDA